MIEDRLGQDNAYNHLEQLTEVEDTVSYTYDANGNRATMVSKVNEHIYATTAYSYNLANMVVSMTNDPSNESAQTFTYTYYLDGISARRPRERRIMDEPTRAIHKLLNAPLDKI